MNPLSNFSPQKVEAVVIRISRQIDDGFSTDGMWRIYSEEDVWAELAFCIMSSRVRFEIARYYWLRLRRSGLLNPGRMTDSPETLRSALLLELSRPINGDPANPSLSRYPFAHLRSDWLARAANRLYRTPPYGLVRILDESPDPQGARTNLVSRCTGVGMKEASMFLRNIRYCSSFAVLDTHVLDFMRMMKLIDLSRDLPLRERMYLEVESIFGEYARRKRATVATLDFAIWVVMRQAKRLSRTE